MGRRIDPSWGGPLSYFSFKPVLHDWCNKGRGMCHPVCGMMHIKEPLLLIGKSSPCGGCRFPLSLSEGPLPYVRRHITVNKMCWVRRYIKHFSLSLSIQYSVMSLLFMQVGFLTKIHSTHSIDGVFGARKISRNRRKCFISWRTETHFVYGCMIEETRCRHFNGFFFNKYSIPHTSLSQL